LEQKKKEILNELKIEKFQSDFNKIENDLFYKNFLVNENDDFSLLLKKHEKEKL
jgi:hypothetical protein